MTMPVRDPRYDRYGLRVDPRDEKVIKEVNTLLRLFDLDAETEYCQYWEGTVGGPQHFLPFHIKFDNKDKSFEKWRPQLHYATARKMKNAALKLIDLTNAQRQ